MNEHNLLNHWEFKKTDKSNFWTEGGPILDIPVFPPDTISFNGIGKMTPFEYKDLSIGLFHTDTAYFLCGHDLHSRYTVLKIGHQSSKFIYKYGGKNFPQVRTFSGYGAFKKSIYISGGLIDKRPLKDMWYFNIEKEQWYYIGNLPSTRWEHNITPQDDGLWLFGGRNKSDIDNMEMRLNDLWFYSFDTSIWTQYDQMALLPHGEAAVLGKQEDGWVYVYYINNRELWRTSSKETTEFVGVMSSLPLMSGGSIIKTSDINVWKDKENTYLAFSWRPETKKGYVDGHTKYLYRWDSDDNFTEIDIPKVSETNTVASLACVAYNENDELMMIRNSLSDGVSLLHDTLELKPSKPPTQYISKCETEDGEFYITTDHLCHWDFNTFHCSYFPYKKAQLGSKVCYDYDNDKIWLYEPSGNLHHIDYRNFEISEVKPDPENVHSGILPQRKSPLICLFKNKIWIVGGLRDNVQTNDFDTFDLSNRTVGKVNMLDAPPTHRRHLFVYNRRMWLITRNVDCLWCFDDNFQIWKKLSLRDDSTMELSVDSGVVSQRENYLIISGQKSPTLQISLDTRRISTFPGLTKGSHIAAVNKSFILVSDSPSDKSNSDTMGDKSPFWIYIYDVSVMKPATHNTPPFYENTNDRSLVDGSEVFPIFTKSFMTWAIDELGQRNCLYKDTEGVFWIDQKFGRYYDFDEEEGFYNPGKDYGFGGDTPESLVRWIPSFRYLERDPFAGSVLLDFEYNGEHFVLENGLLHRMRFSDGYRFSHNVPCWNGCAAGINSRGELFIFGGSFEGKMSFSSSPAGPHYPHNETYDSDGFKFVHYPPDSEVIKYKSHNGFHLYDVNYIAAQTEYLNDIPDFYERFDYDLARDYLVDMKKKLLSEETDDFNFEKAGSIEERVYTTTQDIIDDLAVRYITNESGNRPYARTYPLYGQIGDYLYIGGGVTVIDVFPIPGNPYRLFQFNDIAKSKDPETGEEVGDFDPSSYSNRGMFKFDMINRKWSWSSKLPMGKTIDKLQGGTCYCSTMILRPKTTDFYVVGGATGANFTETTNEIWIFKTTNDTWEKIEYVPDSFKPRHSATCVWLDDDRLLISYGYITHFDGGVYKTAARGDQWILNAKDKIMYKISQDMTKKFVVIPGERAEDTIKLLFWGENKEGAKADLTESLKNMHKEYNFVVYEKLCQEAVEELTSILIDHLNLPSTGGANNVNSTYLTNLLIDNYDYLMRTYQVYQEELIGAEFFDATRILRGDFTGLHTYFITWVVEQKKEDLFKLAIEYLTKYPEVEEFLEELRMYEAITWYEMIPPEYRSYFQYYYENAPFSNNLKSLPYSSAELKMIERGQKVRELIDNYADFLESVRIYKLFQLTGTSNYFENVYRRDYDTSPVVVELTDNERRDHLELIRKMKASSHIPATFFGDLYLSEIKRKKKYNTDLKEYHEHYDKLKRDWEYAETYAKRFSWGDPVKYWRYAFLQRGYKNIPSRPPEEPTFGPMSWKDTLLIMRSYSNIFDVSTEYDSNSLFIIDIGLTTGRPSSVRAIYSNSQISLEPEDLLDIFTYKDKSLWFSAYIDESFGFWRLFNRVTDADYDLDFLAIDQPSTTRPLATAFNNNDKVLVVYNYQNIYELDLRLAMYNPNADYWHLKAPAVNMRDALNNEMKSTFFNNTYIFFTKEGRIITHNPESMIWVSVREDVSENDEMKNVLIDGKELYYLGDYTNSRYFDLTIMQGDRFMIDSSMCEHDDKNLILPKTSVQRNMVFGFDKNNNLVYAWTRKHGSFDVSYNLGRYFHIKEILLSVDQNSLDIPAVVYAETSTGSRAFHSIEPRRDKLWSFDDITRRYYYESLYTLLPDQYIVIPINDDVSNLNIVFSPPASGSSYIARLNGVLFVPEDTDKILPTELKLSCPDTNIIGLRSYRRDTSRWTLSSDNRHIQLGKGETPFGDTLEVSIPPGGFITVDVRCLKLGEIGNILAIDSED